MFLRNTKHIYSLSDNSCNRSPGIDEDESEDDFSAFTDSLCRPIACIGENHKNKSPALLKTNNQLHPRSTTKAGDLFTGKCIGCRNYHGLEYNDEKLICAFHLSGWNDDDNCPDFLPVDTNQTPI